MRRSGRVSPSVERDLAFLRETLQSANPSAEPVRDTLLPGPVPMLHLPARLRPSSGRPRTAKSASSGGASPVAVRTAAWGSDTGRRQFGVGQRGLQSGRVLSSSGRDKGVVLNQILTRSRESLWAEHQATAASGETAHHPALTVAVPSPLSVPGTARMQSASGARTGRSFFGGPGEGWRTGRSNGDGAPRSRSPTGSPTRTLWPLTPLGRSVDISRAMDRCVRGSEGRQRACWSPFMLGCVCVHHACAVRSKGHGIDPGHVPSDYLPSSLIPEEFHIHTSAAAVPDGDDVRVV